MKMKLKYFLERADLAGASKPLRLFQAVLQNQKAHPFPKCPDESFYVGIYTHRIYSRSFNFEGTDCVLRLQNSH